MNADLFSKGHGRRRHGDLKQNGVFGVTLNVPDNQFFRDHLVENVIHVRLCPHPNRQFHNFQSRRRCFEFFVRLAYCAESVAHTVLDNASCEAAIPGNHWLCYLAVNKSAYVVDNVHGIVACSWECWCSNRLQRLWHHSTTRAVKSGKCFGLNKMAVVNSVRKKGVVCRQNQCIGD